MRKTIDPARALTQLGKLYPRYYKTTSPFWRERRLKGLRRLTQRALANPKLLAKTRQRIEAQLERAERHFNCG